MDARSGPRHVPSVREYAYKPLNELYEESGIPIKQQFRLLCLAPGITSDFVHFTLREYDIIVVDEQRQIADGTPSYEAVSYCWNGDHRVRYIWSDGGALLVSAVVLEMLIHLRWPDTARWLWIDAICINQRDTNERSSQVSMMRLIYNRSKRTLVWLGPAIDETADAFRAVERLTRARETLGIKWDDNDTHYSGYNSLRHLRRKVDLPVSSVTEPDLRALTSILENPYFERVWIVQESTVSRCVTVIHGREKCAWSDFLLALLLLYDLRMYEQWTEAMRTNIGSIYYLVFLREKLLSQDSLTSLRVLSHIYRHAKATDLRDKVYALVGISTSVPYGHRPMLSYDISVPGAYHRWTVHLMEFEDSLEVLYITNVYPKTMTSELPSWVPDWSFPGETAPKHFAPWPAGHLQASGSSRLDLKATDFLNDFLLLGLDVLVLDCVSVVGERLFEHPADRLSKFWLPAEHLRYSFALQSMHRSWDDVAELHRRSKYTFTQESIRDAYWQTITYGSSERDAQDREQTRRDFEAWYSVYRRPYRLLAILRLHLCKPLWILCFYISLFWTGVHGLREPHLVGASQKFHRRFVTAAGWRKMIRTRSGYIGLASYAVERDDTIVLAKGSRVPLVIRRVNGRWRLVGEAYVHGVMYGEKWDESQCTRIWIA